MSIFSFRVGLLSVYFANFVGLQLKESFQHFKRLKAAKRKYRNTKYYASRSSPNKQNPQNIVQ